jgi:uncharacterized cupin superfamily protein
LRIIVPVTVAKLVEPLPSISLPQEEILEGITAAGGLFTASTADGKVTAGFWSCGAGRYRFHFGYDEFVYVIRGEVHVSEEGTDRTLTLAEGDTAHFPQGVTTIWQVTRPLTKYFVAREGAPG